MTVLNYYINKHYKLCNEDLDPEETVVNDNPIFGRVSTPVRSLYNDLLQIGALGALDGDADAIETEANESLARAENQAEGRN